MWKIYDSNGDLAGSGDTFRAAAVEALSGEVVAGAWLSDDDLQQMLGQDRFAILTSVAAQAEAWHDYQ